MEKTKAIEEMHIGKLIKAYVDQRKISKTALAEKLGITRDRLYAMFEQKDLNGKTMLRLCEALDCNMFTLYQVDEKSQNALDELKNELKFKDSEVKILKKEKEILQSKIDNLQSYLDNGFSKKKEILAYN